LKGYRSMNSHRVALSITDGRTVRDLFYNGLLDYLQDFGFSVTVFTEATRVQNFTREWQGANVEFAPLMPAAMTRARYHAFKARRKLMEWKAEALLGIFLKAERRYLYPPRQEYLEQFRQKPTSLLVATHAHLLDESELINTARSLNIPTLGIVRSWDNVYKGLQSRTDHITVWSEINRNEVINFDRYDPSKVTVTGATQFDPYFHEDTVWSREKLAEHFNLDPRRPIIVFASLGYFMPGFDETCWMDLLLAMLDQEALPGRPHIICRLSPMSGFEHFQRYASHPDVCLSYVHGYHPGLTWYMTREDVVLVGNMLRHADVVITPTSTITLEAAIFDRPTIVPIFHPYQPERAKVFFNNNQLGQHFGRIERLDLVPIIRKEEDFAPAINRCLQDPDWYKTQRAQLVRDYVHFTDGHSVERLAKLIYQLAEQ